MKIKTSELTGAALDWAVSEAEGCSYADYMEEGLVNRRKWSTDWAQGGPIIEKLKLDLDYDNMWYASDGAGRHGFAPTLLEAAMRCYVASKLGNEVEIPEELL